MRIAHLVLLVATDCVFLALVEPNRRMTERRACRARWDRLVMMAPTVKYVLLDKGFTRCGTIRGVIYVHAGTLV